MSVKESGEEMADKFLVIDGSSLIHRAFFALPPLMTKQGVHTGAVYGFCNMLVKLCLLYTSGRTAHFILASVGDGAGSNSFDQAEAFVFDTLGDQVGQDLGCLLYTSRSV